MEATLTEPISFPAESYVQTFFHNLPTDSRFLNCSFAKFLPSTTLDADTQQFNLARFEAPNIYQGSNYKTFYRNMSIIYQLKLYFFANSTTISIKSFIIYYLDSKHCVRSSNCYPKK